MMNNQIKPVDEEGEQYSTVGLFSKETGKPQTGTPRPTAPLYRFDHAEYCNTVWSTFTTDVQKKIEILQRSNISTIRIQQLQQQWQCNSNVRSEVGIAGVQKN